MYILLYLCSLFLAFQTKSIHHNFTYLSYQPTWRFIYMAWIVILSCFLLYKVIHIYHCKSYLIKKDYVLIFLTFISMLVGSLLPYLPNTQNIYSSFHVFFSSLGCLGLLIIIKIAIHRVRYINNEKAQKIENYSTMFILFFVTLIILFGSINIVVEMFYTTIIFILLYMLENI